MQLRRHAGHALSFRLSSFDAEKCPIISPSVVCCSWCVFYSPPRYQKLLVAHSSLQQTQEWRISAGIDPKDKSTTGGCVSTPRTTALSLSASFRASQSKTHTRKVDGTRKRKRKIIFFFFLFTTIEDDPRKVIDFGTRCVISPLFCTCNFRTKIQFGLAKSTSPFLFHLLHV